MLIQGKLSYKIVGLCMEIHNEYGNHHNERIYHNLLKEKFDLNKIKYISQPQIAVFSKTTGKKIGVYIPDFLVDDKIIIEIKAKLFNQRKFSKQIFEYVKITPYKVAYLINFGLPSLYFNRIIY